MADSRANPTTTGDQKSWGWGPGQFDDQALGYLVQQQLAVGESTLPRDLAQSSITMATQQLRVAYFTALKTESISQVRLLTTGTAAGATPTLVRVGIWTSDGTGALLALAGSTPNDTALLAAASTAYTKALSAAFTKQAGQRYGVGLLVVTAAAAPTVGGLNPAGLGAVSEATTVAPAISALVGGQNDLPATVAAGSLAASTNRPYVVLLP